MVEPLVEVKVGESGKYGLRFSRLWGALVAKRDKNFLKNKNNKNKIENRRKKRNFINKKENKKLTLKS